MEPVSVITTTDWNMFWATIIAGVIAALATVWAVRKSNDETRKQLRQQQEQHRKEKEEQNRLNKFVMIKPMIMSSTLGGILDKIIMQNDYDRKMLFTGDDGFDFFDDIGKRNGQVCRILQIQNDSNNNINNLVLYTESCLKNKNTNNEIRYKTKNVLKIFRPKESVYIRIANQQQLEKILKMNNEKEPSEFVFDGYVEYSTEAKQRIRYHYMIRIYNGLHIEIEKDEIENIENIDNVVETEYNSTVFRNLQDYIPFDRSAYFWQKMGQNQAMGAMPLFSMVQNYIRGAERKDLSSKESEGVKCSKK